MKTLIKNIGLLATPTGNHAKSGEQQGQITLLKNVAIACENGNISHIYQDEMPLDKDFDNVIDAKGNLVTPGLVDSHTHLVFGGWRQHEVPLKLRGASYLEILQAGGGILDTVRNTKNESFDELYQKAHGLLKDITALGVTTIEAKSGYGLDLENEMKQLKVVRQLRKDTSIDIVPTFMGAHAAPPEYADNKDGFVDYVCSEVMPKVKEENEKDDIPLAVFCDVFCESGVFDVAQSEKILNKGKEIGLIPKIHADEINVIGAVPLACKVSAISADHLISIDQNGIDALEQSDTIATLLPATSFYLGEHFAPAKAIIKQNIPVAVASDFNPGSCPSYNLQFAMNLAYLKYRMTPGEILTAVTLNGAAAVNMADKIGTVEKDKQCDLVVWKSKDLETLLYRFGDNMADIVIKKGEIIC